MWQYEWNQWKYSTFPLNFLMIIKQMLSFVIIKMTKLFLLSQLPKLLVPKNCSEWQLVCCFSCLIMPLVIRLTCPLLISHVSHLVNCHTVLIPGLFTMSLLSLHWTLWVTFVLTTFYIFSTWIDLVAKLCHPYHPTLIIIFLRVALTQEVERVGW